VALHHLLQRREVWWSAAGGGDDLADLAEVGAGSSVHSRAAPIPVASTICGSWRSS
jgi:hypothetical protein